MITYLKENIGHSLKYEILKYGLIPVHKHEVILEMKMAEPNHALFSMNVMFMPSC